jgi:hypothetical protein
VVFIPLATFAALFDHLAGERQPKTGAHAASADLSAKQPIPIWARMDLGSAKAIDIELPPKLLQLGDALREQEVEIHSHPSPGTARSLADLFDAAGPFIDGKFTGG